MQTDYDELLHSFAQPSTLRSIVILVVTVVIVYWVSRFISKFIVYIARNVATKSDTSSNVATSIKLRRLETYLSTLIAVVRVAAAGLIAYVIWELVSPASNAPATVIGASALFIVLAGGVIGPLLNDVIAGFTMIIERWYSVGDYIKVEPFIDVGGVVERVTLRSTKLRSISGEVIWFHNRTIHGVHVAPYGVRNISLDIFTNAPSAAKRMVEQSISTLPIGATALTKPPVISSTIKVTNTLWRIVVDAKTAPGREWLLESFFVSSLKEADARRKKQIIVHGPIVRYVDPEAEKNFKRAVQLSDKELI